MGLVEQPERGSANHHTGERDPAALTGGQPADGHVVEPERDPQPLHRRFDGRGIDTAGPRPEAEVLPNGEVVVERGVVAEQTDRTANGRSVGPQVVAEDFTLAGFEADEPGAEPQERRFACTVGPLEEYHLARPDREIDPGESRKPVYQGDHGTQPDDGHG